MACASGRNPADGHSAAPAVDESDTAAALEEPAALEGPADGGVEPTPEADAGPRTGALSVTVSWLDPPAPLRRSPGRNACGVERPAPVRAHALGGVAGVAVHLGLDPAAEAPPSPAPAATVTLTLDRCLAHPRVLVLPRPAGAVRLISLDERRYDLSLVRLSESLDAELAPAKPDERPSLPLVGSEIELALSEPGVFRLSAARGAPGDAVEPAYIIVSAGGPVAVTDGRGRVGFDDLAPGRYRITAWHPPVRAGAAPIARGQEVVVEAGARARAEISLAPP